MITGVLKSKIDKIWDAFWSGGISNPLEVIEQITFLLFIRRLDDLHTLAEKKANRLHQPIERPVFTSGQDDFRWSRFKSRQPAVMYKLISEQVFPFVRDLGTAPSASTSRYGRNRSPVASSDPRRSTTNPNKSRTACPSLITNREPSHSHRQPHAGPGSRSGSSVNRSVFRPGTAFMCAALSSHTVIASSRQ